MKRKLEKGWQGILFAVAATAVAEIALGVLFIDLSGYIPGPETAQWIIGILALFVSGFLGGIIMKDKWRGLAIGFIGNLMLPGIAIIYLWISANILGGGVGGFLVLFIFLIAGAGAVFGAIGGFIGGLLREGGNATSSRSRTSSRRRPS